MAGKTSKPNRRVHPSAIAQANVRQGAADLDEIYPYRLVSATARLMLEEDPASGRNQKLYTEAALGVSVFAVTQKLRDYARQKRPELYKQLAFVFLRDLTGADVPAGVFTPWPKTGRPGRHPVPERAKAYNAWMKLGQPLPLSTTVLRKIARIVYERECDKGMRDKLPKYIERELEAINERLKQELSERKQKPAKSKAAGPAPQIPR